MYQSFVHELLVTVLLVTEFGCDTEFVLYMLRKSYKRWYRKVLLARPLVVKPVQVLSTMFWAETV